MNLIPQGKQLIQNPLVFLFILLYLIRVQQAIVDSELHKLGKQVQHLSLQGYRGACGVLLQSFDHQWLKQTNVVVNDILKKQRRAQLSGLQLLN